MDACPKCSSWTLWQPASRSCQACGYHGEPVVAVAPPPAAITPASVLARRTAFAVLPEERVGREDARETRFTGPPRQGAR